jgi:hypothetical protein
LDREKLRAGVLVAVATLLVNSGERFPALKLVTVPAPLGVCQLPSAPQYCVDVPPAGHVTTWLFALLELVQGVPPFNATELNAAPLLAADPKPRSLST